MITHAQKDNMLSREAFAVKEMPVAVRKKAWIASQLAMEVACGVRSADSGDELFADLSMTVSDVAKASMPESTPEDAINMGLGAMQMSFFMGTRLQADAPIEICNYAKSKLAKSITRPLEQGHAAAMARMLKGIATPDD